MKKIISSLMLISLVVIPDFDLLFKPVVVSAQNIGSVQAVVTPGFSFKKDLQLGDTDPDVRELQRVLNADIDTVVATDGDGSRGRESTYFGEKTKRAVIKFQNKYREAILAPVSLSTGNGLVNKLTRTKLNLLLGVFDTPNSIGLPQNRPSLAVHITPAPTIMAPVVTTTQPQMTICQFIELLISINAIVPSKVAQARAVYAGMACASGNNNLTPRVDLKVNGSNGPVTLSSPRNVTISWTSQNVTSCLSAGNSKPLSGSQTYYVRERGTFIISCTGPYGTVDDVVTVRLRDDNEDDEDDNNNDLVIYCTAATSTASTSAVTWTANATGGTSSYNYSWSGTDNLFGSSRSVSKIYSTSGQKLGTVRITSGQFTATANCLATVNVPTRPGVVYTPPMYVSCSATPSFANTGTPVNWMAQASGGAGNYRYSWVVQNSGSSTNNIVSQNQNYSQTYSEPGLKIATLTVTSGLATSTATSTAVCTANIQKAFDMEAYQRQLQESQNAYLEQIQQMQADALAAAEEAEAEMAAADNPNLPNNVVYGKITAVSSCVAANGETVYRARIEGCKAGDMVISQETDNQLIQGVNLNSQNLSQYQVDYSSTIGSTQGGYFTIKAGQPVPTVNSYILGVTDIDGTYQCQTSTTTAQTDATYGMFIGVALPQMGIDYSGTVCTDPDLQSVNQNIINGSCTYDRNNDGQCGFVDAATVFLETLFAPILPDSSSVPNSSGGSAGASSGNFDFITTAPTGSLIVEGARGTVEFGRRVISNPTRPDKWFR